MRVIPTGAAVAAVLALGGCDFKSTVTATDGKVSAHNAAALTAEEANKIVEDAYASFTSGDAMRIMEHYAPDAVVIDAAHNDPTMDRTMVTKWTADFAAMKPSDLVASPKFVQSFNDDTIVSSGVSAFLADVGGHRQRVSVRYTHVFERQADGSWKIVAEHNSVPPMPVAPGL